MAGVHLGRRLLHCLAVKSGLQNVALFTMQAEIHALDLFLLGHSEAYRYVNNLQDDQGADNRQSPGNRAADQLIEDLRAVAIGKAFPALSFNASLTALVANTPVIMAPRAPPAPCTPNASSESS